MTEQQVLYLSRADVEKVALDMPTILKLLEEAFVEKGNGKSQPEQKKCRAGQIPNLAVQQSIINHSLENVRNEE